jgi:LDH2 family malate/lactate/ureidoglycolate dehydrogenase
MKEKRAEPDGTIISEEASSPDLRTAMLLPIGGTRENGSHKGYGMAAVNELMTHGLGSTNGHRVPPVDSKARVPMHVNKQPAVGAVVQFLRSLSDRFLVVSKRGPK